MIVEDMDFDILDADGETVDTATADHTAGYDFGGVVGYDFGAFRLEADASYRSADIDTLTAGTTGLPADAGGSPALSGAGAFPADGEANVLSFMLNGLFDFGDDDGLQGFVGGGIGVARTDIEATIDASSAGVVDDSDSGLAWQALAGVRAPLTDNIDVGLRYRFFNAENVEIVDTAGRDMETRFRSHSILGTLTFNFGGEEAPPPPPPRSAGCTMSV